MKENKTAWAILGLLSHEDLTGYDLKKRVDNSLGYFWSAGYGQIYPALAMLERRGYVSKRTEVDEKRPKRIVYSLTPAGLQALKSWLAEPVEKEDVKYELLLKLFFGRHSPAGKNADIIEEFRARNARNLEAMRGFLSNLEGFLRESEDHMYYYLVALFGEKVYAAYLEWADEAIAMLREESPQ